MPSRSSQATLPLPRGWRKITRAGVLHAISIAAMDHDFRVELGESLFTATRIGCLAMSVRIMYLPTRFRFIHQRLRPVGVFDLPTNIVLRDYDGSSRLLGVRNSTGKSRLYVDMGWTD